MSERLRRRILVAQHRNSDLEFATKFLNVGGGYDVETATDGLGLIKALRTRPDLILTDTTGEGRFLRAVEIIRRNREFDKIPVVGYSREQHRLDECRGKGMNGFIVKPAAPGAILAKLWRVLGEDDGMSAAAVAFSDQFSIDLDNIDSLPTLPTVFAEVDRLCQNPDVGAEELSRVIETDPSISLKLLSLANSAFFGFSRRINTVHEAISLLGNQTVKNTVLNIAVFEATQSLDGSAGLDKNEFWVHSTAVGSVARFLAKQLSIERDEAFTAGIIHDMGKLIFDALYTEFYQDVLSQVQRDGCTLFQAEKDVIGLSHCQVGGELSESWSLGPELIASVMHHHAPGKAAGNEQIASLVHVGDAVARRMEYGSGGDPVKPDIDPAALKSIGLSLDVLGSWDEQIREAVGRDQSILSILKS